MVVEVVKGKDLESQSIWNQMREIAMFTAPATGLWICGPLMSLIDTAVIGQGSSIELAALGNFSEFLVDFFFFSLLNSFAREVFFFFFVISFLFPGFFFLNNFLFENSYKQGREQFYVII